MNPIQITFYSRTGCHLCELALGEIESLQEEFDLRVRKVNIDTSPALSRRYGRAIPVATIGKKEIFRHRTDRNSLRRLFSAAHQERDCPGEAG